VSVVHGAFVLFALLLVGRAAKVQLFETASWRARARGQQVSAIPIPAPRGMILDASGAMLVESRQLLKLQVAPREVADAARKGKPAQRIGMLARALSRAGISSEWVSRCTDTSRAWVELPGRFLASDVAALTAIRGVHSELILERVPPATDGLRRIVGRTTDDGEPVDGLERSLDAVLRGEPGSSALLRDAKGARFDSPTMAGRQPRQGNTVVLTIDGHLQDIAERALGDAVRAMGAEGGDIVMLDPRSGEVRAMASRRADPLSTGATALTEPYEPGSTLKPFVAARLLELERARVDEVMNTYGGKWELNGRKIVDDHPAARFSLADVIRFSSNIGIVQFAQRFTPGEQYELLRDIGFGAPTGLPYPAEESGRLPTPRIWDKQTAASLAMGYALNVTPLQLAMAYAAIANGGELLQPALVREIRALDGTVHYRHERRVVRRVMSSATARTVRGLLSGVVESGTGEFARLATFDVAGKTGTAKRTRHGRYVNGSYTASFVGLFPADDPQIVILVKLDSPQKTIYGGKAAAPVSKAVLQAVIAARSSSLDWRAMGVAPAVELRVANARADSAVSADSVVRVAEAGSVPYVFDLSAPRKLVPAVGATRAVPAVNGLPVRRAVYMLHRAGFHVTLASGGAGTAPAAGTFAREGSTVRLFREP
jgi:cell division protein FtsI (penicillin-binding protein 3)